ncbi:MAG: DHH family phosphoesterase [Firmicutes bacterium]|nr:DHH family phosphoesterase [Bacillota bacterium]
MNELYRQMIEILQRQRNLLLVGHVEPDGDCVGSLLGLYFAFQGREKNWRLVTEDAPAACLGFLPGIDTIIRPEAIDIVPQAILTVDCWTLNRTGYWLSDYLQPGLPFYCIDHHRTSHFQGDLAVIEPQAAACGEIVAALMQQAGIEPDADTATALYTALAADTGCFRFGSTQSRTLAQAAWLRPQVDIEQIRIALYESRSRGNMHLLTQALNHLHYSCDGAFCYTVLRREDFQEAGQALASDIVNFTLVSTGVKIGMLLEEHDGYVRVSLRSRPGYPVDQLARDLGGGGHRQAAGCRREGDLQTEEAVLTAAVENYLAQLEQTPPAGRD